MSSQLEMLNVYLELAEIHEERGQPQMRDRFLLLAADAALAAGRPDEAERLRKRFLAANPHHIVKPYSSFAQALCSPDVQNYVSNLRKNYPPEVAHDLLVSLRNQDDLQHTLAPGSLPGSAPKDDQDGTVDLSGPHRSEFKGYEDEDTEDVAKTAPLPLWIPSVPMNLEQEDATDEAPPTMPPQPRPQRAVPREGPPHGGTPRSKPAPARTPMAQPPSRTPATGNRRPALRRPTPQPSPPQPAPAPVPARRTHAEEPEGDSVLASFLFAIVMLSGLALFGYTLAKPFLP